MLFSQSAFILSSLQPVAFIIISQQLQLDPGQTLLRGWESVWAERQIPAKETNFSSSAALTHLNITLLKRESERWAAADQDVTFKRRPGLTAL